MGEENDMRNGDVEDEEDDDDGEQEQQKPGARRKRQRSNAARASSSSVASTPVIKAIKPLFTFRGHSQAVSCLQAANGDEGTAASNRVFSSSWDHSLKEWDMERQDCVATFAACSKVITSLHYSESLSLVATSHPDGRVRVWDSRQKDGEAVCRSVVGSSSNSQWVSQVRWSPTGTQTFATSDYAGTVRVWDLRCAIPLGSVDAHDGKALCVDWIHSSPSTSTRIISGGSDCCIHASPFN